MSTTLKIDRDAAFIERKQTNDEGVILDSDGGDVQRWSVEGEPLNEEPDNDVTVVTSDGVSFAGCYVYEIEDGAIKIGVS